MAELRTPVSDPQCVGPYRIVGRLGSGGMGWVYLGRSPSGRAVAVKVVRPELADDQEFRRRFAREVAAARAVSGAFTAAVIDADTDGRLPWLATVYVPGPSLAEAVTRHGPFQESQVRRLGAGLVEALQVIHAAGLVHRDLKPSNVLLAEDGPRVIDFGISRFAGSSAITRPGMLIGTPAFMSPEQMTGEPAGPASDVFSLGGVLAFAATGDGPFGGGQGLLYRVVHEEPALDAVPDGLRDLIGRCLAKKPEPRPALAALLDELLLPSPTQSSWPPSSVAESIRVRTGELAGRRAGSAGTSIPSCLLLHAQALLDAGLTDRLVVEAVSRAGG
ncbi:serine/threonine-protein kinase [Streptomyces sp. NBC_00879]|uniref:serine/threonine-protein kinase n=1 Tax=Streptomyces sp. NBC_00879 TaxID=2975855 RepID=UPI00386B803A